MPCQVLLSCVLGLSTGFAIGEDLIVGPGQVLFLDTTTGPLLVDNLYVAPGALVRVQGPNPLALRARNRIVLAGTIDVSGWRANDVATLDTGNIPEQGGSGVAGGGRGGTASGFTMTSTPHGDPGFGGWNVPGIGGLGGESAFHPFSAEAEDRRPGGGGGGALGPDQPVHSDPLHASNQGLVAGRGGTGASGAIGVVSGSTPPRGGRPGKPVFRDGDPTNDFWGIKFENGERIEGELTRPVPGAGGGAGGDALGLAFPPASWGPSQDEKGGPGGGGGGLAMFDAYAIQILPGGRIVANGGRGGNGEHTFFTNSIGGNGGGGSGGFLILNARFIDLRSADEDCLTALGGEGGQGDPRRPGLDPSLGGDGGPGVIQLHTPFGSERVLLPPGKTLAELSSPEAHVLLTPGAKSFPLRSDVGPSSDFDLDDHVAR